MTPTLSVLIATAGRRPSLADTLEALAPQLGEGDEVLVLYDGEPKLAVSRVVSELCVWSRRTHVADIPGGPHHDWGHAARNYALDCHLARASHVLFIDDDCRHVSGALAAVRAALTLAPDVPHLFRVCRHLRAGEEVIWREPMLVEGNVGTMSIVVPNDPARLGRFGSRYAGDFDFIRDTVGLHGGRCVWREEVIADIWPSRERA